MAAIFCVSSLQDLALPNSVAMPGHWLAYFSLAIFVVRALAGGLPRRLGVRLMVMAMLISIAYGISDEVHQSFVPGRVADAYDVLTDAFGALGGTIACWAGGILSPTR